MKITLKKLMEADRALAAVLGQPIDVKLAYRIRKIAGKILGEMKSVDEQRLALVTKYGAKREDGRTEVPKEKMNAFQDEFNELLKVEVELGAEKIPFECIDGLKISAYELATIEDFIEPPAKPEPKAPRAK